MVKEIHVGLPDQNAPTAVLFSLCTLMASCTLKYGPFGLSEYYELLNKLVKLWWLHDLRLRDSDLGSNPVRIVFHMHPFPLSH